MSYADDLLLQQARISGNAPYLSQAPTAVLTQLTQTFLIPDAYTNINLANSAQNATWTTAVGSPLAAKAADYGVPLSSGVAAGDQVIFYTQSLSTADQTILAASQVSTPGIGQNTVGVQFTTPLITIAANQYVANATIGTPTSGTGTSLSSSNVTAAASTTQPTLSAMGTYTLKATSSSAYSLTYTPNNGSPGTPITGLAVGTTYDDTSHIPGVSLKVTGTLTTNDTCTIAISATPVSVVCTQAGAIGNVAAGTVSQTNLGSGSAIKVSNATSVTTPAGVVLNPYGGDHSSGSPNAYGVDPDDPTNNPVPVRAKIAAVANPTGGIAGAIAAAQAAGAYDVLIIDNKQATGYYYWYFSLADGTAPGISGGTTSSSGSPDNTYYLSGATLTSTALAVQNAIQAYMGGLLPRVGSYSGNSSQVPFNIVNVTSLTISYTPANGVQYSVIEPAMTAIIQTYINGGTYNGVVFPGVLHGYAPTAIGMYNAIQTVLPGQVVNFVLTSGGSPISAVGAAASTTLYRSVGTLTISYTHL